MPERLQLSRGVALMPRGDQRGAICRESVFQVAAVIPEGAPLEVQAGTEAGGRRLGVGFHNGECLLVPGERLFVSDELSRLPGGSKQRLERQPGAVAGGVVGGDSSGRSILCQQNFCQLAMQVTATRVAERFVDSAAHQFVAELVAIRRTGAQKAPGAKPVGPLYQATLSPFEQARQQRTMELAPNDGGVVQ
ncbi:MAG: hypothetical protein BWY25_02861 [Chloroflexi bacterium ADurb.Bin222]|nr:MAG: hypothetical protein BWY25_02861 [Chloroflexi bacterium ADurb.Bin222]